MMYVATDLPNSRRVKNNPNLSIGRHLNAEGYPIPGLVAIVLFHRMTSASGFPSVFKGCNHGAMVRDGVI